MKARDQEPDDVVRRSSRETSTGEAARLMSYDVIETDAAAWAYSRGDDAGYWLRPARAGVRTRRD